MMDRGHNLNEIINDWTSDDDLARPNVALKTYERKKKHILPQINNAKNSLKDPNVRTDGVNIILNNSSPQLKSNTTGNLIVAEGKILGRLVCSICEYKTDVPSFMKSHMRKHSRNTNVICYKCFRRFNKSKDLVNHIRKFHKKVIYCCSICKFKTNIQSVLRKHILIHRNIKLVQIIIEKPITKSQSYDCTICSCKFDNKLWLKKHMNLHEGNTQFVCPVCKNQFKDPDDMKRISDTDNDLMQFQCKCNYKFTMKNPVKAKLILSEGERPFQCEVCSCKFRHPHILNLHMKTHIEPNTYHCNYCSNGFRFMAHLESHLKSHNYHNSVCIKKR